MKERLVASIESGTVIDHITAGRALAICALLGLDRHPGQVTIGLNLKSRRVGRKDVIKVSDREISAEEAGRIALLAPCATLTIVQDHKVASKSAVECPREVRGLVVCPNRRCITNSEPVESRFRIAAHGDERLLRCHYCERTFSESEIESYKT